MAGKMIVALLMAAIVIQVAQARPIYEDRQLEAERRGTRQLLLDHTGKESRTTTALAFTSQHILAAVNELSSGGDDFRSILRDSTRSGLKNAQATKSNKWSADFDDGMPKPNVDSWDDGTGGD